MRDVELLLLTGKEHPIQKLSTTSSGGIFLSVAAAFQQLSTGESSWLVADGDFTPQA